MQGRVQLSEVRALPEAENLIMAMLQPKPKDRPDIDAVMAHPFWWEPAKRLAFLIDLSDRVECEDREVGRIWAQLLLDLVAQSPRYAGAWYIRGEV